MTAPNCVDIDSSVSLPAIALATPKSMTFGTGLPSMIVTRMLAGFSRGGRCPSDARVAPPGRSGRRAPAGLRA